MTSPDRAQRASDRLRAALAGPTEQPAQQADTTTTTKPPSIEDVLEARVRAGEAEYELLRTQVAVDAGLPLEVARFLHGSDRAELEQRAEQFKAFAFELAGIEPPAAPPPADLKQGALGSTRPYIDPSSGEAVDAVIRGGLGNSRRRIF